MKNITLDISSTLKMNLFVLSDYVGNGYYTIILYILSFLAIGSALLVITTKNPIKSVLFLICLFVNIAGYLISIGISFIGLSYLLVYVGAVSILFLFILMLINIRTSELDTDTKNTIPLVLIVTLIFENGSRIFQFDNSLLHSDVVVQYSINDLNYVTSSNWENNLVTFDHINSIGNIMYSTYSIWLIITSIILLLAMVGAIVITIKPKDIDYETKTIT